MEGSDSLSCILKVYESGDPAVQERVLQTILNIVHGCSELKKHSRTDPKKHSYFQLTAKLMDDLAMARAPSIIVNELLNRKVPDMSKKFCCL